MGVEFKQPRVTILPRLPFPPVLHSQIFSVSFFKLWVEEEERGQASCWEITTHWPFKALPNGIYMDGSF